MRKTLFGPILIELMWLTLSLAISLLVSLFLFGQGLLTGSIDLQLYDTYFVLSPFWAIFPLFLIVGFLVFLIKEWRNRFRRKLPTLILCTLGLFLIVLFVIIWRFR